MKESRGENKSGNVRQATIGNINNDIKGKVRKGRGEYNFRLWEITKSYREWEREVQPDH